MTAWAAYEAANQAANDDYRQRMCSCGEPLRWTPNGRRFCDDCREGLQP